MARSIASSGRGRVPLALSLVVALLLPLTVASPAVASSSLCSGAVPSELITPAASVRISHPDFETRGWRMKLRTGPSLECESGFIWAADNLPAEQIGTYVEPATGTHWSQIRFSHNGSTLVRWVETWSVDGSGSTGGSGGCTGATPGQPFSQAVAVRISHPDFETRGWRMKLRTGPSLNCESGFIWAADNLPAEQIGTYVEPATGTDWSQVRFSHNGSTLIRWVESWSLDGARGVGPCAGASPTDRFEPPVPGRVSHPEFENRGWRMKLRTGPSMDCESGFIWANDNIPVDQIGTFVESATGTQWSLVSFSRNDTTLLRWVESWSIEQSGSGGCSGAVPSDRIDPALSVRISHPDFETRGWRMKLRTGPSLNCESGFIWAADNLAANQIGTYVEPGTGTHWSQVRFAHNGSTIKRWVETWSVEGAGGSGGCSGAAPSEQFSPAVSARVSHPQFEARGWRMKLRTGPSLNCESGFIWAVDNLAVDQLGIYVEASTGTSWSFVRFDDGGQTKRRWVETWSVETGGGGGPSGPVNPPPPGVPVVIFDTDMGPDIDDALALAALHEYADQGRAHIAAVTLSRNSDVGARYIDQVNHFYGRPDIPIGVYRNTMGSTGQDGTDNFTRTITGQRNWHPYDVDTSRLPHGYDLMRAVLEASPDNSVVIIQVGFSTNTAELLNRYPDLVRRKARLLSIMAGNFHMPSGGAVDSTEFNVRKHVVSAQIVFDKWPAQLVVSEYDLGSRVLYPDDRVAALPSGHIIKDSYSGAGGKFDMSWHPAGGMKSWDLTSVIAAIEPGVIPLELGPGRVTVAGDARTTFRAGSGSHFLLGEARHLDSSQTQRLVQKMVSLVSSPPIGGNDNPPNLDINVLVPRLNCNGALRVVGEVTGFFDGEDVTVTVGSSRFTRAAPGGLRSVSWRCSSGGSPITFSLLGESSGASGRFTIQTYNEVAPPPPQPCRTDPASPVPAGTFVTMTAGAVKFTAPREPYPECQSSSNGLVGRDASVRVIRETAGYFELADGGWIRKSLTSRPGPCEVGVTLVYEPRWYRAKRTTSEFRQPLETFSSTCRDPSGSWIRIGAEFVVSAFSGGYARVGSSAPYTWVRANAIELADPPEQWCPEFDPTYRHPVLGGSRGIVSTAGRGWMAVARRNTTTTDSACNPGPTIAAGSVLPVRAMGVNFVVVRYRGQRYFLNSDDIEMYTGPRPNVVRAWGVCSGAGVSLVAGLDSGDCVFANQTGDVVEVRSATGSFGVQLGVGVNLAIAEADRANLSSLGGWSTCTNAGLSALVGIFHSSCVGDGTGADVVMKGITIGVGADFAIIGGRSFARVTYITDPAQKREARNAICANRDFYSVRVPFCGGGV